MNAIAPPETPKSNTGKVIGCIGCGCLGVVLAIVGVVAFSFWGVTKAMKNAEPYRASIAAVESNPAAVAALGTPIKPGFMPTGSFNFKNGAGDVDYTIPVAGPKGKGKIHIVGTKSAGSTMWEYTTWELNVEGGETIPLGP